MNLNPLKKLEEFKAALPNPAEFHRVARRQEDMVRQQVIEIQKQTVLMERWANAAELQLEQWERIVVAMETIVSEVANIKAKPKEEVSQQPTTKGRGLVSEGESL